MLTEVLTRLITRSVDKRDRQFWHCWMKYFAPNLLPINKLNELAITIKWISCLLVQACGDSSMTCLTPTPEFEKHPTTPIYHIVISTLILYCNYIIVKCGEEHDKWWERQRKINDWQTSILHAVMAGVSVNPRFHEQMFSWANQVESISW